MGLSTVRPRLVLAGAAMLALAAVTDGRAAAADPLRLEATDPAEPASGDLGPARAAVLRGPRPASPAIVAAKREADAAYEAAVRNGALSPAGPDDLAPAGGPAKAAGGPTIVGGRSFAGLTDRLNNLSPSDATGAIGPTRFIQLVNARFGIYARDGKRPLATGDLTQLAGVARSVFVFDPQIIWDPAARRFYYVMDSIYDTTDNRLLVGFSRTDSPASAADWCHYQIRYGKEFPDFPKLGDSGPYGLIGVNVFADNFPSAPFRRADLIAISKPPAGKDCPAETSFSGGVAKDLRDAGGRQVFTPVPANQVDDAPDGYAVAISLALPSNRLWLFSVGRGRGGEPVVGRGEPLKLPFSYAVPPGATQPRLSQRIDTSDARPTQAVLARNPRRGGRLSLWTQQTVANGGVSAVRWYEIDPVGAPRLADNGLIAAPGVFLFDAAISPDRRVDGGTRAFGDSFVVGYNASSAKAGIAPRVMMASSRQGGPLGFALVREAAGPYRDHTCQDAGELCRWGDYSGATPDPRPAPGPAGVVWLTAQYSGRDRDPPADANWTTWIWAARP